MPTSKMGTDGTLPIGSIALPDGSCKMGQRPFVPREDETMRPMALVLSVVLASSVCGLASARTRAPSLRDRQQAACYNDAQKLCGQFVPDVDKISACMKEKKAEVSAGCRKYMK